MKKNKYPELDDATFKALSYIVKLIREKHGEPQKDHIRYMIDYLKDQLRFID